MATETHSETSTDPPKEEHSMLQHTVILQASGSQIIVHKQCMLCDCHPNGEAEGEQTGDGATFRFQVLSMGLSQHV